MAWYEIFIVSVGLSLDVFTYALYKGAMLSRLDKKQILKMILLFTGWQSGAMLLGSLISELPYIAMNYQRTERLFRAASAVIFFLIGIWHNVLEQERKET
jgi:putative Mn2+ efflux pump MntP